MEEYIKNQFTESYNGEHWFDLARELAEIREKERARLPYSFNIVDELRANENAHTRVLIKLLSYTKKGEYPFLKTFPVYTSLPTTNSAPSWTCIPGAMRSVC